MLVDVLAVRSSFGCQFQRPDSPPVAAHEGVDPGGVLVDVQPHPVVHLVPVGQAHQFVGEEHQGLCGFLFFGEDLLVPPGEVIELPHHGGKPGGVFLSGTFYLPHQGGEVRPVNLPPDGFLYGLIQINRLGDGLFQAPLLRLRTALFIGVAGYIRCRVLFFQIGKGAPGFRIGVSQGDFQFILVQFLQQVDVQSLIDVPVGLPSVRRGSGRPGEEQGKHQNQG